MGEVDRDARHRRHDAAVARRSVDRRVPERSPAERRRKRHDPAVGGRRRAGRQPEGSARTAAIRRGLDDRRARRRPADARGLPDSGQRHDRVSVLRGADQLHRRQVGPGIRSAARQSRGRPSRDRLRAAASASHATARAATRTPAAPTAGAGVYICRRHGHSAGPDRRRPNCRPTSRNRSDQTIGPRRRCWGPQSAATCPGTASRVYPLDTAMRARRRFDAHLSDALHDERQAHDRPDEHRLHLREDAVRRPICA